MRPETRPTVRDVIISGMIRHVSFQIQRWSRLWIEEAYVVLDRNECRRLQDLYGGCHEQAPFGPKPVPSALLHQPKRALNKATGQGRYDEDNWLIGRE